MSTLLVLIAGYAYQTYWSGPFNQWLANAKVEPLPGTTSITALIIQNDSMTPTAEFDYFYTGVPVGAYFTIELEPGKATHEPMRVNPPSPLKQGQQHVKVLIDHPPVNSMSTTTVAVVLRSGADTLASKRVEYVIAWPDWETWFHNRELAGLSLDALLQRAVELIDANQNAKRGEAQGILEQIIHRDKRYAPAYVELARIAMKSNWGPEGLHQAENLLSSALQIDPDSVNAKILLGYVYTHQKQHAKAEALFSEAASTDTKNLWLWTNWGELLAAKGDFTGATKKYHEAINRPMSHDSSDRARLESYRQLLAIVSKSHNLDDIEALYKQRAQEFSECGCYTEYAKFLIEQRGNSSAAIDLTRKAIASGNDVAEAKNILGVAYYLTWSNATGEERTEALNQARVYLPEGPKALYLLATNDRTVLAVKQLIHNGENIDQYDNEKRTALALALQDQDSAAVGRLLRLGARPDALVGPGNMPAALIPVMYKDIPSIQILQKSGVDYSAIRYQGMTGIDFAKSISDDELLKALKYPHMKT
jgi:Tfp pilus assembly protein PilF